MKKTLLTFLAAITLFSCHEKEKFDAEKVISKFNQNVRTIEKVEYKAQRIDTFSDGFVWNNKGYALIEKN